MGNFKDFVNSVEYHGGDIFFDKDMMEYEVEEDANNNVQKSTTEEYRRRTIEKAKAVAFTKSENRKTYGRLLNNIRDQQSFKIDVYPKSLADAYEMLSAHTVHNNTTTSNKGKKDSKPVHNNTKSGNSRANTVET